MPGILKMSDRKRLTIEKAVGRLAGSGMEKGEVADPACRPLAFSIALTDREPGTG